jgi:cyclic dehypoxanthinyl futalosine synthase
VTRPYQLLAELDFVSYVEDSPPEIARRLHENELDVALIPVSEFAVHGGYVGLDHGLACAERSDSLILCSYQPVEKLETIYLYEDAISSAALLRLLLREEWRVSPRLLRVGPEFDLSQLREKHGMLLLQEGLPADVSRMPLIEDLVTVWDRLTGKPFVFSVWAVRPAVLTLRQHQALHEQFHRCVTAASELISASATGFGVSPAQFRKFLSPMFAFYLDDNALAGLNSFCDRAGACRILPRTHYQSATFTLLNRRTIRAVKERELTSLLSAVLDGERLGVRDGVRLAELSSLADLGMAADYVRAKVFPDRVVSHVCFVEGGGDDAEKLVAAAASAEEKGAQQILLLPREHELTALEPLENAIAAVRARCSLQIEAFTAPQILRLAERTGRPLHEVVSRLVTAGVQGVSGLGGGMLIDRILRRRKQQFTAADWLEVMKWVHRFGAKSSCCLLLGPNESWEERVMHLHKLRALQDENPGIRSFHIDMATEWKEGRVPADLRVRATMISRLFLDNVASIQEAELSPSEVPGVLSLCFGANEVRVDVSSLGGRSEQTLTALRALRALGMDFSAQILPEVGTGEVH